MRPLITMMMTVHDIDDDHVVKWEPHQKRIWIYGPGVYSDHINWTRQIIMIINWTINWIINWTIRKILIGHWTVTILIIATAVHWTHCGILLTSIFIKVMMMTILQMIL